MLHILGLKSFIASIPDTYFESDNGVACNNYSLPFETEQRDPLLGKQ